MKVLILNLIFFLCLLKSNCFLTDEETDIFFALVRDTFVRNCLIAPKEISSTSARAIMKTLSQNNVFTTFLERKSVRRYLENNDMRVYRWTSIVLKEETLNSLDYFGNKSLISSYFWILFDGSNGTLRNEMLNLEIPFDSAVVLIEKLKSGKFSLNEYYKIKKTVPGIMREFGEWTNNTLKLDERRWFDRKSNMQKYEFVTVKFNEELYLTPKEKVNEAIWQEFSNILNFTIIYKSVPFGSNKTIETFDGEEEEALLDTEIYIGKNEKFRYLLGPTSQSKLYMHIKAEGEYKGLKRFLKPFSNTTWLSVGVWVCLCGIFEFIVEYLLRKARCSEKPANESFHTLFIPLYFLCNQDGVEPSNNVSSRFIIFVIRVSATIIYYAYAATFISYLLLYIPQLPFTDLKSFVEDGSFRIIAERNSDIDTFFNISTQPIEQLIYKKFLSDVSKWTRLDKEIDRICKGEKLVLIAFDDDIDGYRPCNILKIKKPLQVFANGFKIRFRSPFRGLLHIKLLLLRTTGILQRVNSLILQKPLKKYEREDEYELHLEKVSFIFMLLLYGYLLSLGFLALEIIADKLNLFSKRTRIRRFIRRRNIRTN